MPVQTRGLKGKTRLEPADARLSNTAKRRGERKNYLSYKISRLERTKKPKGGRGENTDGAGHPLKGEDLCYQENSQLGVRGLASLPYSVTRENEHRLISFIIPVGKGPRKFERGRGKKRRWLREVP